MATNNTIGLNIELPIYNSDGSSFHGLVLHKSTYDSVVMSLGDKITGDVYYPTNDLAVTTQEYVEYNGIKFLLVNHPTIVREGMASDNTQLKGMTKYSFVFYHPMYMLGNFPFSDVAVTSDQTRYLSEGKKFSWIGYPDDYIAKLNKNLEGTEWIVEKSSRFPQEKDDELSPVLPFDDATIADALKVWYDTWKLPYIVDKVSSTEAAYAQGKRFKVVMGLASNEIYASESDEHLDRPFVFKMGKGVGLKNNSRTPRNNKIVTRIAGRGSEDNVPYGYPQIRWFGTSGLDFTYGDHAGVYNNVTIGGHVFAKIVSYPIYKGILGGAYVELIKHPFTRKNLMPSIYRSTLFNKISFLNEDGTPNTNYNPDIELVDYYDAVYSSEYPYPNTINNQAPSYESHEFEDVKPELGEESIVSATPLNNNLTPASSWDDSIDDNGNYKQSYFQIVLPRLSFDIYACAAITEEMQINMRSGACLGCSFTVQVDWDDYKKNFYDDDGNFAPNGSQRNLTKYPKSNEGQIAVVVQKDDNTFGTLLPNMYQNPVAGDAFVVLGISLPESYVISAESRLDNEMKSYMLENNVHYFDYPLKFDEAFLATHAHILRQVRPNTVIRFEYAGEVLTLSVKQLTIKYGESPLPKYDITLTDNVEVVLNQIGQVAEGVEKLSTLIAILRQSYGKNVWNELSKKLSKVENDIAYGDLDFRGHVAVGKDLDIEGAGSVEKDFRIGGRETVNELQSSEYTGDGLLDTGYRLWYEEGRAKLVIDDLVARGKFTVNELETRIWTYAGGNMVFSGAGSTLFFVEYLDASDNPLGYTYINQPWLLRGRALLAGGLAWSKRKAIQRELTEAEKAQVVKFRCYEYSDDGTMQTRNWWKPNDIAMCETLNKVRSKANSDGSYSGSASNTVYKRRVAGIGSKQIPMLNDGRIYDYVDLWNIYDLAGNSCKYKGTDGQEHLITDSVKGYDSSYHDWPAACDVIVQMGNPLDTDRQSAVTIEVQGDVHGFKVYDTISDYSMANKLWVELGYDQTTGKAKATIYGDCYIGARPSAGQDVGSTYLRFLRDADGQGNGLLEIKAVINLSSPLGSSGQTFSQFMTTLSNSLSDINNQLDKKAETWYQNSNPESIWYNPQATPPLDERSEHVGDMWYCTEDISGTNYKAGTTWYYQKGGTTLNPTYTWKQQNIPQSVFDTIDRKSAVYTTWNAWGTNLQVRDLYIPSADHTEGSGSSAKTYKKDKVYRCTNASIPTFEEINYTDDSNLNDFKANQYVIQLTNGTISSDVQDAKDSASDAASSASSASSSAASALTRAQNAESSASSASSSASSAASSASSAASSASSASSSASSASSSASSAASSASSAASSASQAASDAASAKAKADALDYVKNALNSDTEVAGGLLLTSLIALRQKSGNSYITTGGMQGYKGDGTAIGFWMGGAMTEQSAKIVFRHNGSGFMAGNKFSWDENGNAKIGGFVIGADYIGQNSDISQQDTGYTYITRNGYINVKKANNGEALRVNGTANIYGTLYTQTASSQYINGSNVNINTGSVVGTNTYIGNSVNNLYINAGTTSITGAVSMSSTLGVSGSAILSGLLAAKGSVKTGTFTLPGSTSNPPEIGTIFICKGISSDMTVSAPYGFKIQYSDNRDETQSINIRALSSIFIYMGAKTNGTKIWAYFKCDYA